MFLENKNCFLLLHHYKNQKQNKSGIQANNATDGGRMRRISPGQIEEYLRQMIGDCTVQNPQNREP